MINPNFKVTKTPTCAAELRGSNEQCGMAEKSDQVPQSGGGSPATGDGSSQAVPATKKVYDRVLLWMLDVKQVKKDIKISPLVEVGPPPLILNRIYSPIGTD